MNWVKLKGSRLDVRKDIPEDVPILIWWNTDLVEVGYYYIPHDRRKTPYFSTGSDNVSILNVTYFCIIQTPQP